MITEPYKVTKRSEGWIVEFDPDERWAGVRANQKHFYSNKSLESVGVINKENPYAEATEYGTPVIAIVWNSAPITKVMDVGHIIE